MKRLLLLVAASAFVFASCNKNPDNGGIFSGDTIDLTVNAGTVISKATSVTAAGEKTVNSLQVFVFRTDDGGSLDVCGMASENSVSVKCTSGPREIYALVNAPDITGSVFKKSDLLAAQTLLGDNASATSLVMVGSTVKTLTVPGEEVTVEVKRVAASVAINKVSVNFSSPALAEGEFKISGIYLINVNGKNNYALDAPTEDDAFWYNRLSKEQNSFPVAGLVADLSLSEPVTVDKPYDKVHTFYCYPNDNPYVANSTWSLRSTMLVVEATYKGLTDAAAKTYYYPISVGSVDSNKKYIIPELIITRLGSLNPFEEVTFSDCTFSVTVKDWDETTLDTETI